MLELLKILVNERENRDEHNRIIWNYVDADAWHYARKNYESDDAYFDAFNSAADQIEPLEVDSVAN